MSDSTVKKNDTAAQKHGAASAAAGRSILTLLGEVTPQPPAGIKYMLGGESWLPKERQTPRRMHCEEWGNLGPMELDPAIKANKAGFRVRSTDIPAPAGANGFTSVGGVYYWTAEDEYGRDSERRSPASAGPETSQDKSA